MAATVLIHPWKHKSIQGLGSERQPDSCKRGIGIVAVPICLSHLLDMGRAASLDPVRSIHFVSLDGLMEKGILEA